jgi:hypothetical protein
VHAIWRSGSNRVANGAARRKHSAAGGELRGQIIQGVLNELCDYFDFDDEGRPA